MRRSNDEEKKEKIKCIYCDTCTILTYLEFLAGDLKINGEGYICEKCNESFCTSDQMNNFLSQYRKKYETRKT